MKKERFLELIKDLYYAVCMAVFITPVVFLADIILLKTSSVELSLIFDLIYIFAAVFLYGAALLTESQMHFFIRLGLSVPMVFLCLTYFWETSYSIRALNWVYPHYGKPGPGTGLMMLLVMTILLFNCIAVIVTEAFFLKPLYRKIRKIQFPLCSAALTLIILIVVLLERQFPPISSISL